VDEDVRSPPSGVMKPYPFSPLNHFTVPVPRWCVSFGGSGSTADPVPATGLPRCSTSHLGAAHLLRRIDEALYG
jgi:hypothetical protein